MQPETDFLEKRMFPRVQTRCPLLYRVDGMARRMVGICTDFSATGVKMVCKQALAVKASIDIEFKPGSNKSVPAMTAQGQVVRCEPIGDEEFLVACRFTRVQAASRP